MKFYYVLPVLLATLVFFSWIKFGQVNAQTDTSSVTATIKLSVCGDSVVENPEDCEDLDLNGQDCESIGFGPGNLACDIACEFDTTDCTEPTPGPSSTPTTAPASSTTSQNITPSVGSSTNVITNNLEVVRSVFRVVNKRVLVYDFDGDGLISSSDLKSVVSSWVESSFEEAGPQMDKCDLDENSECDMVDFSILMYYINRST